MPVVQRLGDLGHVEAHNLTIDFRKTGNEAARLRTLRREPFHPAPA